MNDKKTVSFGMALAIIFLPILVILLGGLVLRVGFLVPLMLATITASLLSIMAGFTWKEVEACIVNGVHRIIIVTCILFLVGTLIGVWIQAGVIPLFLYWGLKLLSPSMFLVSTVLICAVFSLMTGTSFGTIGTAGLALLGVGEALGFPTGLTAGAIVSGAYFGDKMSPVSDTTNLASGITGTNIFSHIGSMLYTTVPATLVALGLYWYLGLNYSGGAMPDLTPITDALSANFNRSFLLALPPIVLVALAIRGIPPLPTLVIAILVGVVCAFVIQDGMTVKGMFKAATDGYVSQTGHPLVDKILSRGGLTSMSFVVFLLLIAMTLGGILEGTGALGVVVDRMTRSVTSPGGLILATLVSCYLMTISARATACSPSSSRPAPLKRSSATWASSRGSSRGRLKTPSPSASRWCRTPWPLSSSSASSRSTPCSISPMPSSTGSSPSSPSPTASPGSPSGRSTRMPATRPPNPKPSRRGLPAGMRPPQGPGFNHATPFRA